VPGDHGGRPGDLYVILTVQDHPIFSRHEDDLVHELPLPFVTAILGGKVEVPTLRGTTTLKIPPGAQHGQLFRLKGLGVPHLNGHGTGDLLMRTHIAMPTKLTAKQRTILQEYAKTTTTDSPASINGEPESIVEKVKNLFE
jgi:molecular chaperone DnaJ